MACTVKNIVGVEFNRYTRKWWILHGWALEGRVSGAYSANPFGLNLSSFPPLPPDWIDSNSHQIYCIPSIELNRDRWDMLDWKDILWNAGTGGTCWIGRTHSGLKVQEGHVGLEGHTLDCRDRRDMLDWKEKPWIAGRWGTCWNGRTHSGLQGLGRLKERQFVRLERLEVQTPAWRDKWIRGIMCQTAEIEWANTSLRDKWGTGGTIYQVGEIGGANSSLVEQMMDWKGQSVRLQGLDGQTLAWMDNLSDWGGGGGGEARTKGDNW